MRDQWKPWVWVVFAFNCLFATVFALLCWESYRQFRNVTKSAAFAPALTDVKEWYIQQVALRCAVRHYDFQHVATPQDCTVQRSCFQCVFRCDTGHHLHGAYQQGCPLSCPSIMLICTGARQTCRDQRACCCLQVCAIYYMIFTRKGLSHPGSRYGKGFMVALTFMCALHICNIATHVSTYTHLF